MSITILVKDGLFKAADCPYSATAIKAIEEMTHYDKRGSYEKSRSIIEALTEINPQFKWQVVIYKDGYTMYSNGQGSKLAFRRDELRFDIVPLHDQAIIDKLTQEKQQQIDKLNSEIKANRNTFENQLERVKRQLAEATQQLAMSNQTIAQRDTSFATANRSLDQANQTIKQKEQELITARNTISQMEQILNQTNNKLQDTQVELLSANGSNQQAYLTIGRYQQEIEESRNQIVQKEQTINEQNNQLNYAQAQTVSINLQLQQQIQRMAEIKAHNDEQVAAAAIKLNEQDQVIRRIENELQIEKQNYQSSIQEKQAIISDFENQIELANRRIAQLEQVPVIENDGQISMDQIDQRLELSDTQNDFIQVLSNYLNNNKDVGISDEILNQRINGCAEDLIKILISKCSDQVKEKLPKQLQILLRIATQFNFQRIQELTADVRMKKAETTEAIEDLEQTLQSLQKKNSKQHLKSAQIIRDQIEEIKSEIEELEQQEKDIIQKFEAKKENVLNVTDTCLKEILKHCNGVSNFQLSLVIDAQKVQNPQEECKETRINNI